VSILPENYKKVKKILWTILFVNLAVAAMKIIIGISIKSASMTADGFHSLTDSSANIVGLIGVYFAAQPVDREHPYGHGKCEMFAGLLIAGMLFLLGGKIIIDAVNRFLSPLLPEITPECLVLLLLTLCVNIFVSIFEYKKGRELNSQILVSDSLHTRSDIYISAGVLVALICIKLGLPPVIDPVASLIVAGFILHAAYEIVRDNGGILLDQAAVDADEIRNIVLSFDKVKDAHKIRSRGSKNDMHVDMHIMTAPDLNVEECHELIHSIEEKIRNEISPKIQVIFHVEPYKGEV